MSQFTNFFPGGRVIKNPPANAGDARDVDSITESGRSPGVENGNLIHYSCLENSMDRGDWQAIFSPGGCKKLDTTEHTHPHTHTHTQSDMKEAYNRLSDVLAAICRYIIEPVSNHLNSLRPEELPRY